MSERDKPEQEPIEGEVIEAQAVAPDEALAEDAGADEPAMAPEPEAMPAAKTQNNTTSMIIGGVLSAALGAGATLALLPEGWRQGDAGLAQRLDALTTQVESLTARPDANAGLDALDTRLSALEGAMPEMPDLSPISDQIAALDVRLQALETAPRGVDTGALSTVLAPLSTRIDALEETVPAQVQQAVDAAMSQARAEVDAQAQDVQAQAATVAEASDRVQARTAVAQLQAAFESGEPAAEALAVLESQGELDAALQPLAEGLPTLAALQTAFAQAARSALAADAPPADAPLSERAGSALLSLFGARSLAPREGDSTDAILSRAEAAVRIGQLAQALLELDALGEAPAAPMADWRTLAQTRLSAQSALSTLADSLNREE